MIAIRVLDAVDAMAIIPRLCARHRVEIARTWPDLKAWAMNRAALPGPQWALEVHGEVMLIGGVVDEGESAHLWFAGAIGWERYARVLLRAFREIRAAALYQRFECRVHADNARARRFAERLGFRPVRADNDFVHYGMTP